MCNVMEMTKLRRELEAANKTIDQLMTEREDMMYHIPGVERPSPKGEIPQSAVTLSGLEAKIVFPQGSKPFLGVFADTNSMEPFDAGHIYLWIEEFDRNKLIVGDIVSYHAGGGRYIGHMIQEITEDEQGRLYRLLGWNNAGKVDTYLVRNEHIDAVLVAWINTHE